MKSLFLKFSEKIWMILSVINHSHRWLLFFFSICFVLLLGYVDLITGDEISLSIFYLLPITLIAWFSGRNSAFLFSIFCTIIWLVADVKSGEEYKHFSVFIWDIIAGLIYYLLISYFLTTIKKLYENEKDLARIDILTGVINRRYFYMLANSEIYRTQRFKRSLSLAFIDVDNFKTVNDTLGHAVGDEVLKTVTKVIRENLRTSDVLARFGGDEFAILLPETDDSQVRDVISKMQKILKDSVDEYNWPVSFSIGVVTTADCSYTVEEIIEKADKIMYSVKKSGKNNVRYHTMDRTAHE